MDFVCYFTKVFSPKFSLTAVATSATPAPSFNQWRIHSKRLVCNLLLKTFGKILSPKFSLTVATPAPSFTQWRICTELLSSSIVQFI